MAGVPWILVFGALTALALWRGWFWTSVGMFLCVGIGVGQTKVGKAGYEGAQGFVSGLWDLVLDLVHQLAT